MLKIAILNFTYNKKSGIENVVDYTLRHVDKIDTNNQYILFVNETFDYYINTVRISKKIIRIANSQALKTFWLLFVYPLYSLIKGIDITVVFNGSSNFSLSPFTKNIIYFHDLGELYIKDKYSKKRMIYRKFFALPINKMLGDVFIAVSKSTQDGLVNRLKISKDKVKIIYNGIDEGIITLDKEYARKKIADKYKIKDSDKILLTVGRIDPVGKNLVKLIEAIDIYRQTNEDFHLFLVGESNFPNSHLVPAEIEKKALEKYITLTGYVYLDELNYFYNASDLLVFPSVHEGFGMPLLEAMKCDLPIACSDIQVFHEVGDDAVIYFDPYDEYDIAKKINSALTDSSLRNRLILDGQSRCSVFNWGIAAKNLIEIINGL